MNTTDLFSKKDLQQIQMKGIKPNNVVLQLERFEKGFTLLKIISPATINNGILKLSEEDLISHIRKYEEATIDVLKFVPASGAATRMFNSLFSFVEKFDGKKETLESILAEDEKVSSFFTRLGEFAFYEELDQKMEENERISIKEAVKEYKHNLIIDMLLNKSGLNYGSLPKGLICFHTYEDHVRTAAQEHLAEGIAYAKKNGKQHVHFTVSKNHSVAFEKHILESIEKDKTLANSTANFSVQSPSTDTVAVTTTFDLFRDQSGELLFRPAGHGALLDNLNNLAGDIIFIKNIDNVVSDRLRGEGIKYKKALAGVLLTYQEKAFNLLQKSENGAVIREEGTELLKEMGTIGDFSEMEVVELLDRPIRVCGMVKNEGEPGGGPFWVEGERYSSLQIVESAQFNKRDKDQLSIFKKGTHFNPVDIVCGIKNYKGEKYNLLDFRDEEAGFISEKSYNGKKLLAMELPGLWNGGMAHWNIIFVEVPLGTFNPVKTVIDLLKPAHR